MRGSGAVMLGVGAKEVRARSWPFGSRAIACKPATELRGDADARTAPIRRSRVNMRRNPNGPFIVSKAIEKKATRNMPARASP